MPKPRTICLSQPVAMPSQRANALKVEILAMSMRSLTDRPARTKMRTKFVKTTCRHSLLSVLLQCESVKVAQSTLKSMTTNPYHQTVKLAAKRSSNCFLST